MRPNFWGPTASVKQEVVAINGKTLRRSFDRKHERAPCRGLAESLRPGVSTTMPIGLIRDELA
jgi:hypothetical protein